MTNVRVVALSAVFSHGPNDDRFCTYAAGNGNLQLLGSLWAKPGKDDSLDLVGLYVPEGINADDAKNHNPDPQTYGRIIAAARCLPITTHSTTTRRRY
jgi:hypothetical protein